MLPAGSQEYWPFNSRPHKEVDFLSGTTFIELCNLSTHDLTRRSTSICISKSIPPNSFNSRPHKEVDEVSLESVRRNPSFNSRPHKEVDRLRRLAGILCYTFNSRPHKEVDILVLVYNAITEVFQLTTSQGGRQG